MRLADREALAQLELRIQRVKRDLLRLQLAASAEVDALRKLSAKLEERIKKLEERK